MSEQRNDLLELLRILLKWKKPVIIVTISAAVLSAAYSWFFMPNYYKSAVTFYPSNPVMNDRQVLYSTSMGELKIDYFGSSSDVDRILTLAHTSDIEDYIINKFHLIEHYGYDSTDVMGRYKTKKRFEKNFKAIETEYSAVEVSVWDQDKELAATIANHIVETIDNRSKELIYNDKKNIIETFEQQIGRQNENIAKLIAALDSARVRGINPVDIMILDKEMQASVENRNENQKILEQFQTSANTNYSTVHITQPAYPALRKDKPVRSLIVAGATIAAFVFMILLAVITENYKKIKAKLNNA